MRNFIYKIKSKIINIDIKSKRKLIIGISSCLFIAAMIFQLSNANAASEYTLTSDSSSVDYYGKGSAAHVSGDYAGNTFSLDGGVGVVFCTDPNRPVDNSANAYMKMSSAPTNSYFNVVCGPSYSGSLTCASNYSTRTYSATDKKVISLVTYYYQKNSSDAKLREAVQTIIWEIATGGRTNSNASPTYTETNSWYKSFVDEKSTNYAKAYKAALSYARNYSKEPSNTDGATNKLTWNSTKNKWYKNIASDSNGYKCSTSKSGVTIDQSSGGIEVTVDPGNYIAQSEAITIKCSKDDDGNSSRDGSRWYCKHDGKTDPSCLVDYQKLVEGYGTPTVTTNFKIWTEGHLLKVIKKNEKNENLSGAVFTFTKTDDATTKYVVSGNGSAVTVVPGTYTVEETTVPTGYTKMPNTTITINSTTVDSSNTYTLTVADTPLMINWYKTDENGTKLSGAKFKVNNGAIKWSSMGTGKYASCYVYDPNGTKTEFISNANGEVCIIGIPTGNYSVTETQTSQYHTFGRSKSITVSAAAIKQAMTNQNRLINYPTTFEFSKSVSDDETNVEIKNMNTSLLQRLKFNIKYNGRVLSFQKISDGVYKYIDGQSTFTTATGPITTDLQLNSSRKITIKYLPWTLNYVIEEKADDGCTDAATEPTCSATTGNKCNGSGYYWDTGIGFTVTQGSNDNAISYGTGYGKVTASLVNTPVEIEFNKDDIYKYHTNTDKSEIEKDENIIDTARFVLRDAQGNIIRLKKIADGHYRYLPITETGNFANTVTELNTKDGKLKITHLCRNQVYYIEEVRTTNAAEFILPTDVQAPADKPANWVWEGHPYVKYTTPNTLSQANNNKQSITQTISNIPTRIRFEKRDLKYGYLISDEKTTFKVYRCDDSVSQCHANADESNIVNFDKRAIISEDNEDGSDNDIINSVEVYRYSKSNAKNVQELHPYKGILVFRYLPAGYYDEDNIYHKYKYVLVETQAPEGYDTPVGEDAEIQFEVSDSTIEIDQTKVPNKPSKIIIRKYDSEGNLLTGARFRIYKVNKEDYNVNLSAENQKKTLLSLKTKRDGVYEYRKEYDTTEFTTCTDKETQKCSDVTETLIHDDYNESVLEESLELKQGEAVIQYLDVENWYVIEEVKAPEGYKLPENSEDRFKLVYLKNSVEDVDVFTELINTETTFQFYKFDEYNQLLDGSEFKLQKLNDNKKYVDVTLTKTIVGEKTIYKVDQESENTVITTENGTAILVYLTTGQYRVVETKAAPGKELPKKTLNVSTFYVDDNGSIYGNPIITNKSKTTTVEYESKAEAEVIVNIQTGQIVIKYTLIIVILSLVTIGLFIIKKRLEKK